MDLDECTKLLTGRNAGKERGTIHTWTLSVLFTTLRRISSKSLAVKVPMLKAPPITAYPKEMYFRTVFEDFPFA